MMIPMWMDTSTPPHIEAEARARLKLALEKKGLVENQGKYWTVFRRKIGTYIAGIYKELEENPWLNMQLQKQYQRTTYKGRSRKAIRK